MPVNLEFQVDDVEQEWTFKDGEFDFIHVRYMGGGIRDWPQLLQRCKRYTHFKRHTKVLSCSSTYPPQRLEPYAPAADSNSQTST